MFSWAELLDTFRLADVGKSAGVFNAEKLEWLNFQYQQARPPAQIRQEVQPFLADKGYCLPDPGRLEQMLATLQPRAKTLCELAEAAHFYLTERVTFEDKAVKKFLTPDGLVLLEQVRQRLGRVADWTEHGLQTVFSDLMHDLNLKLGKIAQPVRVALTGGTASPGIFEVMVALGQDQTLARLDAALATLGTGKGHISA